MVWPLGHFFHVSERVDEIELEFANALGDRFDELRDALVQLADRVDPVGAFGAIDEPATAPTPTLTC